MFIANKADAIGNMMKYFDMALSGNPVSIPLQEGRDVVINSKSEYEEMAKAKHNAEYHISPKSTVPSSRKPTAPCRSMS